MSVLIFGSGGLLGRVLYQKLESQGIDVNRFSRNEQYPCRTEHEIYDAFSYSIEKHAPTYVINLVAATNVDECEQDKFKAALLNCYIPFVLSRLCMDRAFLLHISSDQVYQGDGPHIEDDARPINIYALTKKIGEYPIIESGGCVLRTNFFGKSLTPHRASISDWLVHAGRSKQFVSVFRDVFFNPLGMSTLSEIIIQVIKQRLGGLYNLGATTSMSKSDFAYYLFNRLGLDSHLLKPVNIDELNLSAPRPNDMRMNCNKFCSQSGIPLPTLQQEIENEAKNYD